MKLKLILILSLLMASVASAQEPPKPAMRMPMRPLRALGHQFKQTFYTDLKAHPLAWGLNMGIQISAMLADTATSCMTTQYQEVGTARFFVGSHPSCHKFVVLNIGQVIVAMPAENWLAHKFDDSCHAQAASHDPRWDNTPAHTHDPNCFWAVPTAFSIGSAASSYGPIKGNVNLMEQR